jgi:alanyl-tRNA synthetase
MSVPVTRKIFWEDPYLTRLETRITDVRDRDVIVAETILYAFAGGQESDHGTIGDHRILEARTKEKDIVYTLERDHGLKPGDQVTMILDWRRRYNLMRLHFAAEIVLELSCRKLAGIEKIGAHVAQDKARIDFRWTRNISTVLPSIRADSIEIIRANREIISAFSDEEKEERYWEIPGFAKVPCGGTHLRKTGEIGEIELRRRNPGKGKERIEICVQTIEQRGESQE